MGLGSRIQQCLDAKDWSQSDLLKVVPGLERANLSAIIRRDARRSSFAVLIAKGLGCELDWLINGTGQQWSSSGIKEIEALYSSSSADHQLPEIQQQLVLKLFNQLPRHEKQLVLQFIEERIGVCEQMLTDMLNIKGLDVVTRDEDVGQK